MRRFLVGMAVIALAVSACSQDDSAAPTGDGGAVSTTVEAKAAADETTSPPTTLGPTGDSSTSSLMLAPADPWGLSGLVMPKTQTDVTRAFLAMPDEIDGIAVYRDQDTGHVAFVTYDREPDEWIRIFWNAMAPDAISTVDTLETMVTNEMFTIESSHLDAASDFIWLEGFASEPERNVYLAWWGDPAEGWLFMIEADSVEHRLGGIDAFAAIVREEGQ